MSDVVLVVALLVAGAAVVLWRRALAAERRSTENRTRDAEHVFRLELAVAEQDARRRIVGELQQLAVRSTAQMVEEAESIRLTIDRDPGAAHRAAQRTVRAAQASLAQLRRIGTVAGAAPAVLPPPGAAAPLLDGARERGLVIEEETFGEPFPLQDGAEIAVLRVLEYAVDAALTSGGAATVLQISWRWSPTGLHVEINDDRERHGAAENDDSPVGADLRALTERIDTPALSELQERAVLFGGDVTETRTPGVGRGVVASFPVIRHHNGVHGVDLA
ncbi:hypothetical protein [Rathayibacter toxicus]|uniref:Uncharacterized protein n=1 Tax=Rathayibacter toxicus TaxID=145458 RepID=A0A0C5BE37_9MICO|nr:hypothetical protein [Rathayibacter toxicus]AJM77516.1 hypothetical protein TI83_05310 [Rathayibacter toxicus]ALS56568.1 hypothetical protein APU90_01165 [Rathayibacter toxicus]KKM44662.1 hypothetical protein VT73_09130 [Rathayibacter toxicus]PPG21605.1 hypothetical protein C5D15_05105 [Rathayibacter toxicus]PPG46567.1 hypothetical protein C5D16_05080 [Rathayibacter toxicus]